MSLIRHRPPIAEHVLWRTARTTRYVLLRNDGLPEVREIHPDGRDVIISQKFVKIPLPPPDRWWELIDGPPPDLPRLSGWKLNMPERE